jgi:hypothetical protein
MWFLRRADENYMRDQSSTGDKENSGLPWLAVQTPANFLRRTGKPSRLLAHIPIIQLAKPVEKGKLCISFHVLTLLCSKNRQVIVSEDLGPEDIMFFN